MEDKIKPEAQAEIILWDWLRNYGQVYFNRKNLINCPTFRVEGDTSEIPDLLLITELFGKTEAIAIEIKDGTAGANIRPGNKIFKLYLLNYFLGKTKYFIQDKEIKISRFLFATQYSPEGRLFKKDMIQENGTSKIHGTGWLGKCVPNIEYVRTKDFGRQLLKDYSDWRKETNTKEAPSCGWIVSDVIFNFTEEELKIQSGMKGKPIFQGISWNTKLNRWSQFLIKL
jgi:hypothetical protein